MLVQSVAQQCHQDPGSSPLSALPTSTCSSQANSPPGLKMAIPDATYRYNTVAEENVCRHRRYFPIFHKGKLSQRPLRTHCHSYWSEFCHMSMSKIVTNEKTRTTILAYTNHYPHPGMPQKHMEGRNLNTIRILFVAKEG